MNYGENLKSKRTGTRQTKNKEKEENGGGNNSKGEINIDQIWNEIQDALEKALKQLRPIKEGTRNRGETMYATDREIEQEENRIQL